MRSWLAFLAGAALGACLAVVWLRTLPHAAGERAEISWRERAQRAERDLALERGKSDAIAQKLQSLGARFDALAVRLEELSAGVEGAATPTAEPTPDMEPRAQQDPRHDEQWDSVVRETVEQKVERRLGKKLPPERIERLVDQLRRIHLVSADGTEDDPADDSRPAHVRRAVVAEADRAFREEVGVGVAEFLRDLD